MIEKIVLDHLTNKLDVPCYMEEPVAKPDEYVVIERTGSGVSNHIRTSHFSIQSYSKTLFGAASLNEQVEKAMDSLIEEDEVTRSHLNSSSNFTDPTTKRYRYQCSYDLVNY